MFLESVFSQLWYYMLVVFAKGDGVRKEDQTFEASLGYTLKENVPNRLGCSSAVKHLSRICKALYLISNTTKKICKQFLFLQVVCFFINVFSKSM